MLLNFSYFELKRQLTSMGFELIKNIFYIFSF